jgi:hypothetical protein
MVSHHCRHEIRLIDDIDFSILLFLLRHVTVRPGEQIQAYLRLLSDVGMTLMLGSRLSLYHKTTSSGLPKSVDVCLHIHFLLPFDAGQPGLSIQVQPHTEQMSQ